MYIKKLITTTVKRESWGHTVEEEGRCSESVPLCFRLELSTTMTMLYGHLATGCLFSDSLFPLFARFLLENWVMCRNLDQRNPLENDLTGKLMKFNLASPQFRTTPTSWMSLPAAWLLWRQCRCIEKNETLKTRLECRGTPWNGSVKVHPCSPQAPIWRQCSVLEDFPTGGCYMNCLQLRQLARNLQSSRREGWT